MNDLSRRGFIITGGLVALCGFSATEAQAAIGHVELKIVSAGFVFGGTGGDGVLNFRGRRYDLTIAGVSAGATIGASGATLYGSAMHLHRPSDIAGVYSKVGAGMAVGPGEESADLVNPNGVVLRLRGQETGLMFSIDLSGMTIALK